MNTRALLLLGAVAVHGIASAQTPAELPREDVISLRISLLQTALDSLGPDQAPRRIWIAPQRIRSAAGEVRQQDIPEDEWVALSAAFPSVRRASEGEPLFLCPPGERVMMPGSGCPIRDDGVIVRFAALIAIADTIQSHMSLTQSSVGERETLTWMQGIQLLFVRAGSAWRLARVGVRSIT